MESVPYATDKETNYENFIAICPHCYFKNIFNRITDLRDTNPIAFREVRCLNDSCRKQFNINGDSLNAAYETLIFDVYSLKEEKKYSYCILNLAQSFEVFFSLYLRIMLLYKPFAAQKEEIEKFNELSSLLFKTIKDYTYAKMRNIFINTVLSKKPVNNLSEAQIRIEELSSLVAEPPDATINYEVNHDLRTLLMELKRSGVAKMRNNVVHKRAYRPTLSEVELAIDETRRIIFGLATRLDARIDDINWYLKRA